MPSAATPGEAPLAVSRDGHVGTGGVVEGNRWTQLAVPEVGAWTPQKPVSVVMPYYMAPEALAITLEALAEQTYPQHMTQLVVADDGSDPPARISGDYGPADVVVVHQEDRGFGLARARNTGAERADGDIVVFLDCDMVPEPGWLEAHARWHHVTDVALTLGFRYHVDFEGVSGDAVRSAAAAGSLEHALGGRRREEPEWIEFHLTRTDQLTSGHDDLFRVVTGGNLGMRKETWRAVGGFDETFTQWGAEDTEFGYRAFTEGALLIPERKALCWHQGLGTLPDQQEEKSLAEQRARISHLIAERTFRPNSTGRSYLRPMVLVTVAAGLHSTESISDQISSILGSDHHDLEVLVEMSDDHPGRRLIHNAFDADPRVSFEQTERHRFTPYQVRVEPSVAVSRDTISAVLEALDGVGILRIEAVDSVWAAKTRALARAGGDLARAAALFGQRRVSASSLAMTVGARSLRFRVSSSRPLGRVLQHAQRIRTPRDARLFAVWVGGAVRNRVRNRLGRPSSALESGPQPQSSSYTGRSRMAASGPDSQVMLEGVGRFVGPGDQLDQPDFVFIDTDDRPGSRALADEARSQGIPVIAVGTERAPFSADVTIEPKVGPLDLSRWSPRGFRWDARDRPRALAGDAPSNAAAAEAWARSLGGDVDLEPGAWSTSDISGAACLLDHPGLHRDAVSRARVIVRTAARGTPVIAAELDGLEGLVGPMLLAELRASSLADVDGPAAREHVSVAQRRAALVEHRLESFAGRLNDTLRLPGRAFEPITVIVATRRPEFLGRIANAIADQSYPDVQAVFALHGTGFDESHSALLKEAIPDVCVRRIPEDVVFGDALAAATEAADGVLLAKMDDDDWYDAHHLMDLALALEYSQAGMAGKAAEFVYLKSADRTIHRFQGGGETYSTTLAGGAILLSRQLLADVGGWRRVRRHIDRALMNDLTAAGTAMYRTHGLGYVLNRHGDAHTWQEDDDYFAAQADDQRQGLDLGFAGVH